MTSEGRPKLWQWLVAVAFIGTAIILPQTLGFLWKDYRWTANYLSELGATGAPFSTLTNGLSFLPTSILSCIIVIFLIRRWRLRGRGLVGAVLLILGFSTAYFMAVLFPCDFGCPLEGSLSQMIHNLGGVIQYPMAIIGFFLLSSHWKGEHSRLSRGCLIAGTAMVIGFVMMIYADAQAYRGAWQRLGDYTAVLVLSWIFLFGSSDQTRGTG